MKLARILLVVSALSWIPWSAWGQEKPRQASSAYASASGIDLQNLSKTIGPGKDFFDYVNQGWLEKTEIPADRSNFGAFTVLDDEAQAALRTLIEEAAADATAQADSDRQRVGDFFRSYTNTQLRDQLGIKPIQGLLAEVAAVNSKAELTPLAVRLFRNGVGGVFAYFIQPDARRSDQYAVYVTQSGITLPDRDYYLVEEERYKSLRGALKVYIADMLTAVGHANSTSAAEKLVELETSIAKVQWSNEENRDPVKTYNKLKVTELADKFPNLAWKTFVDSAGAGSQESLIVRQMSFLDGINQLFADVPLETWKDYFTFQIVDSYASELTTRLEKRHFDFHETAVSGVAEQKPLWRRGVEACNNILGEIVGKLYVEKFFPPESKQRMQVLVGNLKQAFSKRIETLDWMGPATKKQAQEKLAKFNTKIGYPDKWKDYSKLRIVADDLVGNLMRASQVEYQRDMDKLGGPIDRNEWGMTPQTVNAYYNPLMNEIVFPAAILQPPFFNPHADDAVNYGGIGAVIGHEISHGFDDKGSQYDGDGNLRDWWSHEDRAEFERRANQLVKQYSQYKPFEDMSVNGKFTLGENIGDLGGLSVAYAAYRISLGGNDAAIIDGMSGDQRFFAGWGQVWRRKYREPELRKRLLTDPHSPSRYRANGIVSNIDAFYSAFQIKPDDPMYIAPENRVRIW